jgi:Na+/phosphate symporter
MMDKMERQLRKQSLLRSKIGTSNSSSIIYFEFISNLEQISDLALSLANTVVEVQDQRNKNIKVMG